MKKQLISTLIATSLLISPLANAASNDDSYKVGQQEQLVGIGSGAAVGAAVGGPLGAVVGAMVGGIVGTAIGQDDYIKAQDEELVEVTARNQELERISQKYNQAQLEIARLEQERYELLNEQRDIELALEMNVHFRTGSEAIEPMFQSQLDEVAEIMKHSPAIRWELAGFADRRGSVDKNLTLSERRVAAVRNYLEQQGVPADQLTTGAFGDKQPLAGEQNFESDFFDRRVTLRSLSGHVQTAQQSN
ncbi:cell envelope biogenesis protein OmpA [Photobacterium aquae]|uniref:Cell envelope biogenesis protein OmpA n=1 Tax=Photobacterium aquae TaxID=1195763 RepID=A0A0J1JMP5_9GAMM|nr:sortase-associated OmpA-like protein PdsO [Photobacterium aquae]KLV03417.1 cell envelope biogenesis protein OmpA [Photobacterium aquae]